MLKHVEYKCSLVSARPPRWSGHLPPVPLDFLLAHCEDVTLVSFVMELKAVSADKEQVTARELIPGGDVQQPEEHWTETTQCLSLMSTEGFTSEHSPSHFTPFHFLCVCCASSRGGGVDVTCGSDVPQSDTCWPEHLTMNSEVRESPAGP